MVCSYFYNEKNTEKSQRQSNKISIIEDTELSESEKKIYETLKIWRRDKAQQLDIPSFMVCHNTELMTIAKIKPQSPEDFRIIKGFGEQKTINLADDIIALLNSI